MGIRDISLKTKLLVTNALMIAIPICVLVAAGAALLGGRQARCSSRCLPFSGRKRVPPSPYSLR